MQHPTQSVKIKQAIQTSDFEQAIVLADKEISQSDNGAIEFLYLKAVAQRLSKRNQQAIHTLDQLIERKPDYGRAFQEQGYCFKTLGQSEKAASGFYKATRFNPALLASWQQIQQHYQSTGNTIALAIASEQIAFLQKLQRPVLGAMDLMYEGQLHKAEQVCRQFLLKNKHDCEAMMLLAEIGIKLKVYHDAEFLLESCVELYPQEPRAAHAYQSLLLKLGKYAQALSFIDSRSPEDMHDRKLKLAHASALSGVGKLEQATSIYLKVLNENDDQPQVWLSLGHVYKSAGQLDKAIEAYKKAAHYQPDFGDAYWSLANTKTYTFDDTAIAKMNAAVKSVSASLDDRIHLYFALGKAYEDGNNIASAFACYKKGNTLKSKTLDFDIKRVEGAMENQKAACTTALFSRATGCPAPDPIFIVGLPRAGSTLLEQILASHSQIDGTMELHDILGIASRVSGQKLSYPHNLSELSDEQCCQLGELYIQQTKAYRQGAPFFIDKMPNNFIHIGLIKRILPHAKIIDARRDPFACCFSGYKQLFADGQEFTYSLDSIGRYYNSYLSLMDHWHNVLPGQILTVQHEDVLDDLPGQVKRMLDYLDLPFESACLAYHETKRAIKTPSSEQVRQPIFQRGRHQYKPFIPYLDPLFEALGKAPETP